MFYCLIFFFFSLADGKTVDATQEMLALGACNLISSFVGSMPISGALSRGAVNNASGVKTPFGGIYTGKTNQLYIYFNYETFTLYTTNDYYLCYSRLNKLFNFSGSYFVFSLSLDVLKF